MTTTTPVTQAPGSCPPSAVVDMIVPWTEVGEGDLVLWDGEFRLVERNWIWHGPNVRLVQLDGDRDGHGTIPYGTYAAVRRYDTGEA